MATGLLNSITIVFVAIPWHFEGFKPKPRFNFWKNWGVMAVNNNNQRKIVIFHLPVPGGSNNKVKGSQVPLALLENFALFG